MKVQYLDLIEQTFDFPQEEFLLSENNELLFHGIDLMKLVEKYGTPLKVSYLPKISANIGRAKNWFGNAMQKHNYGGTYHYCYCTKSSHFSWVMEEALKNDIHLETSSEADLHIVEALNNKGLLSKNRHIICNGFKPKNYLEKIAELINNGFSNMLPVVDNFHEIDDLSQAIKGDFEIGIRIASEEEPKFEFYTSRLGIGYKRIVPFYLNEIKKYPHIKLKMLHFFINTGIRDNAYYWNELTKCLRVFAELKKVCPTLTALNIGGGFPIKQSLAFDYDYAYMAEEIIGHVKATCEEANVDEPDIYTEFGSFTVGESGATLFSIIDQKKQNDREAWNMINGSFMTALPDTWAINQRFIMLPVNNWGREYERVLLGGLTCDSDDYYNSEQHVNAIFLPKYKRPNDQVIGFFNTGAYQESVGGFGGLQHCLLPTPRHILLKKDAEGNLHEEVFSEPQSQREALRILGY